MEDIKDNIGDGNLLEGLIQEDLYYSAYNLLMKKTVRNVNQTDVYWAWYKLISRSNFVEAERLTKRYFYWFNGKKWGI